ncbi:MAG: uroporphyrinogen decarboxylase family protein [Eubacteriales bacterium]|nr:uroporphyrinogen decarboxylase family protein [Eubacteriales bacterium]
MNKRELIEKTLKHESTGITPVSPLLCGITRRLTGVSYPVWSTDAKSCADSFVKAARQFDLDCLTVLTDLSVECSAWGQRVLFPENEAPHPDYSNQLIKTTDDYGKIVRVDWKTSDRMRFYVEVCRLIVNEIGGEMPVFAFVFGPLGTLSMCRGQQDMFMDMYDCSEKVAAACNEVTQTLAEYTEAVCDTGVDGVMLDTLFASGSIMSKNMWREAEGEQSRMLAETIRKKGKKVLIHNCGQKIYFDAQIEYMQPDGISFLYPPDDCANFCECKAKYGDKTTLVGCVPPTNAVFGTDDEWESLCKTQIAEMGGSGFILATGCEYPANAEFGRAKAMVEIARGKA